MKLKTDIEWAKKLGVDIKRIPELRKWINHHYRLNVYRYHDTEKSGYLAAVDGRRPTVTGRERWSPVMVFDQMFKTNYAAIEYANKQVPDLAFQESHKVTMPLGALALIKPLPIPVGYNRQDLGKRHLQKTLAS